MALPDGRPGGTKALRDELTRLSRANEDLAVVMRGLLEVLELHPDVVGHRDGSVLRAWLDAHEVLGSDPGATHEPGSPA